MLRNKFNLFLLNLILYLLYSVAANEYSEEEYEGWYWDFSEIVNLTGGVSFCYTRKNNLLSNCSVVKYLMEGRSQDLGEGLPFESIKSCRL